MGNGRGKGAHDQNPEAVCFRLQPINNKGRFEVHKCFVSKNKTKGDNSRHITCG